MGVIEIKSPGSDQSAAKDDRKNASVLLLELNADEARILLLACQRYRATIPSYIQAKKDEVNIMDRIIQKLKSES